MNDTLVRRLADFCADNIGTYDFQESVIDAIFQAVVRDGDTVVDGGAHVGRHTATLARLAGAGGRVFAFEPLPALAQQLAERFSGQPSVAVFSKALADRAGRTKFFFVKNNPSYSGMQKTVKLDDAVTDELDVDVVTLDSVLQDAGSCRLIKLDLEGAEFPALRGAMRTVERSSPLILFENELSRSASEYGYSKEQFVGYFRDRGYRLFDIAGTEIEEAHWDGRRPHFENFIAARRDEDLRFVQSELPGILVSALLEMSHAATTLTGHLFQVMQWIAGHGQTALFGAGNRGRLILEKYPVPFSYVVDNDRSKWGKRFCGMDVRSPESLTKDGAGTRVVIISLFGDEIERQVLSMGIPPANVLKLDIR